MSAGNRRSSSFAVRRRDVEPAARAAGGASVRAAARRRRRRRIAIPRVGQQRQPQRSGHRRELVERALERHHEPHDERQRLEPLDHGPDAQRRDGEREQERLEVGRRGHGQPQRPEQQRREQELVEDLRDGRRARGVGGAQRAGDEQVRPERELGRQGRALRLRLGVRGRGQEPLRPGGQGRGLRRARPLRWRRRGRRRGGPLRRPHGRRGQGLRRSGPRRDPPLRRAAVQLPRPCVLRPRWRLLPALHLPRRPVLPLHAAALGLLLLDGPGRRDRADRRRPGAALLGRHLLPDDLRRGCDAVPGGRAAGGGQPSGRDRAARGPRRDHDLRSHVLPVREHLLQARGDERQGELRGDHEARGAGHREGAAGRLRADAGGQHDVLPLEDPLLPQLPRPERRGAVRRRRPAGRGRAGDPGGVGGPAQDGCQGSRARRPPRPRSRRRSR